MRRDIGWAAYQTLTKGGTMSAHPRSSAMAGRRRGALVAALFCLIVLFCAPGTAAALTPDWFVDFAPASEGEARFDAVTVAPSGNIVAAGCGAMLAPWSYDAVVSMYTPGGGLVWTRAWSGGPDQYTSWSRVGCDARGNVYVAATMYVEDVEKLVVASYSPRGRMRWVRVVSPVSDTDVYPLAMIVNPRGSVYVCCEYTRYDPWQFGLALVKFDKNGRQKWAVAQGDVFCERVALDRGGNALVTGFRRQRGEPYSIEACYTAKYSPAGQLLWEADRVIPESLQAFGGELTLDGGDVIVAGHYYRSFEPMGAPEGAFVIRYAPDGTEEWCTPWAPETGGSAWLGAPVVDVDGDIYLAATYTDASAYFGEHDKTAVLRFAADGTFVSASPLVVLGESESLDILGFTGAGDLLLAGHGCTPERQGVTLVAAMDKAGTVLVAGSWPETFDDFYDTYAFAAAGDHVYGAGAWMAGDVYNNRGFLVRLTP